MFQPRGDASKRFASRMALVGAKIGARLLGYNITAVPPGMRAFPLHNHHVNEEMFFILSGSGELRVGEERHPLRAGDFIANPPGGPEVAHQIINTGNEELRYLAVSTLLTPEVVEYPDSGKFARDAAREAARWIDARAAAHRQAKGPDWTTGTASRPSRYTPAANAAPPPIAPRAGRPARPPAPSCSARAAPWKRASAHAPAPPHP